MNPNDQMMQQMFKVQIAMMAHVILSAYNVSIGEEGRPPFNQLSVADQDAVIKEVEFHLANPDAPVGAAHESWVAQSVADGWRLGPAVDPVGKFSPYIRPFDSLSKTDQIKEHLFRAVVKSVTYTQNEAPAYHQRMQLLGAAVSRRFPDITDATEATALWNALTEEERQAEVDKLVAERDAIQAKNAARMDRIKRTMTYFTMDQDAWLALTEDERLAKLDEYGEITGEGPWLSPEEKVQAEAQKAAMERIVNGPEGNPVAMMSALADEVAAQSANDEPQSIGDVVAMDAVPAGDSNAPL